jgi:hypothetical protein
VAALIEQQTSVPPEILAGDRGEFTVWVGSRKVAQKDRSGFPDDAAIVAAVRQALQAQPS